MKKITKDTILKQIFNGIGNINRGSGIQTERGIVWVDKDAEIKEFDWDIEYCNIDKKYLKPSQVINDTWDKVSKANYCRSLDANFKIIAANFELEGVPKIELEDEDFWETVPVKWVKWTKRKPDWNGSVYMQYNGKNQGNALVHDEKLLKLEGLANSEFDNYEYSFYWLEQLTNEVVETETGYKANRAKYTEEDIEKAYDYGRYSIINKDVNQTFDTLLQSINSIKEITVDKNFKLIMANTILRNSLEL